MLTRRFMCVSGVGALVSSLPGCLGQDMLPGFSAAPDVTGTIPAPKLTRTLSRPDYQAVYKEYPGERFPILAFDSEQVEPLYLRQSVEFKGPQQPGSIVIDPASRHLYYVESPGVATRYGVGVGREGFLWAGEARIQLKRDWPDWVPPREMVERQPEIREKLEQTPRGLGIRGGPKSPLGARAMYLWDETPRSRLPHPRHDRAGNDRRQRLLRLHSHGQPGHRPSLCARGDRHAGDGAGVERIRGLIRNPVE